ncbi:acetyl-CoA C-acetyltransferase [bacterium]|nr:acetyl-CoA C-acetyltransferase [bacterium]
MAEVVILDAVRTAIGKYGGTLIKVPAADLGAAAIKELVTRHDIPAKGVVDDVIMGMVCQGGAGQIPSRQAAMKAGLDPTTPSMTINKVCASGMRAVTLGALLLSAGEKEFVIAGGMESMSQLPYYNYDLRWGKRMFDSKMVDAMVHDGLWCVFDNVHMADHGDRIAKEFGITREQMDEYAARSQNRAEAAIKDGVFEAEIVPFMIPQRKGDPVEFKKDEFPRFGTTIEGLAKLRSPFGKDSLITAGNAPGVNDAGGAMILVTEDKAKEMGKEPLAKIIAHDHVAMEPYQFPIAPAYATKKLLDKVGLKIDDIDLFECNEAFAAVVLACGKIVEWDMDKVNVNGGAIALGHPIGMSGARVIMTLAFELKRRGGGKGIASICSGSGQGDAILIEV